MSSAAFGYWWPFCGQCWCGRFGAVEHLPHSHELLSQWTRVKYGGRNVSVMWVMAIKSLVTAILMDRPRDVCTKMDRIFLYTHRMIELRRILHDADKKPWLWFLLKPPLGSWKELSGEEYYMTPIKPTVTLIPLNDSSWLVKRVIFIPFVSFPWVWNFYLKKW